MKTFQPIAFVLLVVMLAFSVGCASIKDTKQFNNMRLSADGQNVRHINAKCNGLYFLWIPLITGDIENHNSWVPKLLSDTVTLEMVSDQMTKRAEMYEATMLVDLQSSRGGLWIPLYVLPFVWRYVEMSGNAIK